MGLQTQLADLEGPLYANAMTLALSAATDDTRVILALAQRGMGQIYRPGYRYSKCSILLMDLSQRGEVTPDLFAPAPRRGADRLMAVMGEINKREMLSPCYTTRWPEVIGGRD